MDSSDPGWDERGLRAAVLAGDGRAWRSLYDRFFDSLYAYIRCRARRMDLTEEAVQECWLVAVRRVRSFDPDRGSFEAWIRGVADNVLRSQRRRLLRNPSVGSDSIDPPGPDGGAERAELSEQIALTLTALPMRYQAVLRAKYEEELSVAEIASRWGESPKALESLLSRARAAFREAYARLDGKS